MGVWKDGINGGCPVQNTPQQVSPDPVLELVRRDVLKVIQKSFLIYLAASALFALALGTLSFVFGEAGYPWTGYQEILGFTIALSVGIIYLWAKRKSSRGLGIHFYILGVLGLSMGGFVFGWGGFSLLSAGYYERQASKCQGCKCWRDGGDLVVVGGETLACLKCSRKIRIGFDAPKLWNRLGLVGIVTGIVLVSLYDLLPSTPGALLIIFLGYLLFSDGLILSILPLYQPSLGGYVRIPVDEPGSSNSA
jgi:hypothetical protein